MKRTAVVILNWNGVHLLRQFLPTVIKFSPQAEIIVADNASSDDSVAMLKTEFPDIRIILHSENKGFTGGYTEALKHEDAEFYCLLNSDIEVTSDWKGHMEALFER